MAFTIHSSCGDRALVPELSRPIYFPQISIRFRPFQTSVSVPSPERRGSEKALHRFGLSNGNDNDNSRAHIPIFYRTSPRSGPSPCGSCPRPPSCSRRPRSTRARSSAKHTLPVVSLLTPHRPSLARSGHTRRLRRQLFPRTAKDPPGINNVTTTVRAKSPFKINHRMVARSNDLTVVQ